MNWGSATWLPEVKLKLPSFPRPACVCSLIIIILLLLFHCVPSAVFDSNLQVHLSNLSKLAKQLNRIVNSLYGWCNISMCRNLSSGERECRSLSRLKKWCTRLEFNLWRSGCTCDSAWCHVVWLSFFELIPHNLI